MLLVPEPCMPFVSLTPSKRRMYWRFLLANDHLLSLRTLQHFHHGHRQDQFLLADQLRCAQQLGYGAQQSLREVEIFMKHHYRKMTMVDQVVQLSIDRLHALGHLTWMDPIDHERQQP